MASQRRCETHSHLPSATMKLNYLLLAVLAALCAVALAGDDVAWCMSKTTCAECVKGLSCVWCPEEGATKQGACFHGKPWGKIDNAPIESCKNFRYVQCKMPGLLFMILVCAGAGVVVILLFTCICCCCCCRKRRTSTTSVALIPSGERYADGTTSRTSLINDDAHSYSSTPITDQRRREMNEKYNKYRSPAESYY